MGAKERWVWTSVHGLQGVRAHGSYEGDRYVATAEQLLRHPFGLELHIVDDVPSDIALEVSRRGVRCVYHDDGPQCSVCAARMMDVVESGRRDMRDLLDALK